MPRKKDEEEEEVYQVEVITKARVSEDGDWEYLVKWAGYDSDADSWEPSANVRQCERLLTNFWKHIGTDNNDYPLGYETAAGEDWIDKEKRYFAGTLAKSSKQKSAQATNKKGRQERRKSKSSTPPVSESCADESESSDEVPSAKSPVTKKFNRKGHTVNTESESEFDGHLRKRAKVPSHPTATTQASKDISKVDSTSSPDSTDIKQVLAQVKQLKSPSMTGGLSTMTPKVTAVRTHQDQRTNPRVKSMNLPSQSVESGSLLSTKQRVAAGVPPPTGPKPLPPAPKKSLPSLSFKKNKSLVLPSTQMMDTKMSSMSIETPISPMAHFIDVTNDANVVASPQPMDVDQPVDLFGSILDNARPLDGSNSEIITVPIPLKSQEEIDAEKFLQTIHIPVLSDPLEIIAIHDQPDQSTNELNKTLAISKIPKKWKWSGDLLISSSENKSELLCAITITDPSGISNSSHINLLLLSLDSLQISKLYSIMDLSPLLRACGGPQYYGILESSEPSKEVVMHGLECHLISEGLAALIPLLLDGIQVAVLIIFPRAQQGLTKVLQVPNHLLSGTLLVVLLPLLVSAMAFTSVAGWRSIETVVQSSSNPQDEVVFHELSKEAVLYQAMSLLCFPKALLDFLNNPSTSRAYCIWPLPHQLSPGLDTAMLQCVLKSTKAILAKLEEDARVIFISNSYLEVLHTMPSLVTKRVNSPEIQFWTYGYSASITCERWKVQEIYPLGGVVTFTASALAEDLVGCHWLISQIIEHPLWDCYLIPEVLAVSHLLCSNENMSSPSELCLGPILDLINLGLISATRLPEKDHSNQVTWLSHIFNHSSASGYELLEVYLGVLRNHSTTLGMTAEQLNSFTNDEVIKDLSRAQIQPAFMEKYRRFVVIRAASENTIPFDQTGLEWSSLSMFSFQDDYFQP